jgi:hypothetical protein
VRASGLIVCAAAIAITIGTPGNSRATPPSSAAATEQAVAWAKGPRLGGGGAVISGDALARTRSATTEVLHGVVTKSGAVRYRRLEGGSWVGTTISPAAHYAPRAVVEVAGGRIYAAWVRLTDLDLRGPSPLYVRSVGNDGAGTWGPVRRVTALDMRADGPSVAAAGRRVYVAYTDTRTGAIKVAMSRDRGATWSTLRLGRTTRRSYPGVSGVPSVVAHGSVVAVVWVKDSDGTVRLRRSTDGGATWHHARTVGTGSGQESQPGLAMRGDRIAVAWADDDAVQVRIRGASGWEAVRTVDPPGIPKVYPAILDVDVDLHGTAAVGIAFSGCWAGCAQSFPESADVLWAQSTDNGSTWTPAEVVLAGAENPSDNGSVVVFRADLLWAPDGTRYVAANKVIDFDLVFVPLRVGMGG